MKIIPLELELEYWKMGKNNYHTARFSVLSIEWISGWSALLDLGWYQGQFEWDILFFSAIQAKLEEIFKK